MTKHDDVTLMDCWYLLDRIRSMFRAHRTATDERSLAVRDHLIGEVIEMMNRIIATEERSQ